MTPLGFTALKASTRRESFSRTLLTTSTKRPTARCQRRRKCSRQRAPSSTVSSRPTPHRRRRRRLISAYVIPRLPSLLASDEAYGWHQHDSWPLRSATRRYHRIVANIVQSNHRQWDHLPLYFAYTSAQSLCCALHRYDLPKLARHQVRKRISQLKNRRKWEEQEVERIKKERGVFLEQAAHNYMRCLQSSNAHDIQIFRVGVAPIVFLAHSLSSDVCLCNKMPFCCPPCHFPASVVCRVFLMNVCALHCAANLTAHVTHRRQHITTTPGVQPVVLEPGN
jgi:hypothetical protein